MYLKINTLLSVSFLLQCPKGAQPRPACWRSVSEAGSSCDAIILQRTALGHSPCSGLPACLPLLSQEGPCPLVTLLWNSPKVSVLLPWPSHRCLPLSSVHSQAVLRQHSLGPRAACQAYSVPRSIRGHKWGGEGGGEGGRCEEKYFLP